MTLGEMRQTVASFMKKKVEDFSPYGYDVLTWAINNARDSVQRECEFEYANTIAQLDVNLLSGSYITSTTRYGTAQTVVTRRVKKAWEVLPNTPPFQGLSIPYMARWQDAQRLRTLNNTYDDISQSFPQTIQGEKYAVQHGQLVYLVGYAVTDTTQSIAMDVLFWLPPLIGSNDTDFILQYGEGYVVLKAVQLLNFYILEDERVSITDNAVQREAMSLKAWNVSVTPEEETY